VKRPAFSPRLPPGSTPWLLAHELRLTWRGTLARRGGGARGQWIAIIALGLVAVFAGVPMGLLLRRVEIPVTPLSVFVSDAGLAVVFTLMLSQTVAAATEALYQRGDLDLLFSSPLPPRRTLTVRFLALATNVFMTFAALASAFLIPIAVIGHPAWLGAYLVLAALALSASGLGLALAMGLFALIGPRRTRAVAQVVGALIGAAFFLASQARNILGGATSSSLWVEAIRVAGHPGFVLPPAAAWPLRAMLGDPLPLAALGLGGLAVFLGVVQWLSRRFAADAAAASGADTAPAPTRARRARFAASAFAATVKKELRLLWRDAALISQVLLRVLYLAPLGFLLIRNAGAHFSLALPGGAAGLVLFAGQVAGSLAWITVSAEDAPDLLVCAPTPTATFWQAKLAAAFLPLAVLLSPILVVLTALAPGVGLAAAAGCTAVALASGLVNIWYQKPSKRADFRRRRGSSWFATLVELVLGFLIAAATGLAAAGMWWAAIPALLAAGMMAALRRSDAQIARALRTAD
jgi:ABC-2 type transport system permease protein